MGKSFKRLLYFFAILTIAIYLGSKLENKDNILIEKASNLSTTEIDSIESIIDRITNPNRLSDKNRAKYLFLSSKVTKDLNQIDSVLNESAKYYSSQHDNFNLGLTYYEVAQNSESRGDKILAIAQYQRFIELYPKSDATYAHACMNLAFLHSSLSNAEESIYYFKKSYQNYRKLKDYRKLNFLLIFQSLEYLNLKFPKPDSTIYYSQLALSKMNTGSSFLDLPYSAISRAYYCKGEYQAALNFSNLSGQHNSGNLPLRECINRANIFFKLKDYDSSLFYINKIKSQPFHKDEKHKLLSKLYIATGQSKDAIIEQNAHYSYLDSIYKDTKKSYINNLELLLKANKTNEQYWYNQVIIENRTYKLILTIITIILVSSFAFYYYQWQLRKQKEKLRDKEIDHINSLNAIEKQKRKESELRENFFKHLNLATINTLNKENRPFTSEKDWDRIFENANIAFEGFTTKLKNSFPLLNNEDIRYCCLIKMGLTQSEISTIVSREKSSVKKRIRRIALNKMHAKEGQRLTEILHKF